MYLGVVLNPLASKSRADTADRCARFRRIVGPWGEVHESRSLDHLGEIVAGLLPRVTHLVSDGGDGTLHWLLNEVRRNVADPECWPAFVPSRSGTIDFVARKARVRGRAESILSALAAAADSDRPPPEVYLDTLSINGLSINGASFQRVGFALAAGGVGCRFFDRYYEAPNPGRAAIVKIIARAIADTAASAGCPGRVRRPDLLRPTRARVVIDGAEVPTRMHTVLNAGSFDVNLGSVLRVFPQAREPGVLQFQAGEMSPATMIAQLPALVFGAALRGDRLCDTAGSEMTIEVDHADEPLSPIIDGERFTDLERLVVSVGQRVRIARPTRLRRAAYPGVE
ncbi:MAG: retinol dehydrogenase [Mycobacterium sp.]